MNILVIGNGFDLEHELPTTYWEFLMFIKLTKKNNSWVGIRYKDGFEELNIHIQNLFQDEKYINTYSREKANKFLGIVKHNIWIDYFLEKIENKNERNKGWIDFESEIANIIKQLDCLYRYNQVNNRPFEEEVMMYNEICDIAVDFIDLSKEKKYIDSEFDEHDFCGEEGKEIIDIYIDNLTKFIRSLEIYLEEVVEKIDIPYSAKDIEKIPIIDKVLSFNYTYTYEKFYKNKSQNIEYDYIHGNLNSSGENNMVLGIDEYLNDDEKNKYLEFIGFKKYFQRLYKKTSSRYKHWIKELNISRKAIEGSKIYFFGHSLDITDKDVLQELILGTNKEEQVDDGSYDNYYKNVEICIYYHNKEAFAQQITNLVKIIGQNQLIERVSDGKIKFIQQQKH